MMNNIALLLAIIIVGSCLAYVPVDDTNMVFRHRHGQVSQMPIGFYATRTVEYMGYAPINMAAINMWRAAGLEVVIVDPSPPVVARQQPFLNRLHPHQRAVVEHVMQEVAGQKSRGILPPGQTDTIMLIDIWTMCYNDSSTFHVPAGQWYCEQPNTPLLYSPDLAWYDWYNECDPTWGAFGVDNNRYGGSLNGFTSNTTHESMRNGLLDMFHIDANWIVDFQENWDQEAHTYDLTTSHGRNVLSRAHVTYDPVADLQPPLTKQCFYYVSSFGHVIPCTFVTGKWYYHTLNSTIGDSIDINYYPHTPMMFPNTVITDMLFFEGDQEFYEFLLVGNYRTKN